MKIYAYLDNKKNIRFLANESELQDLTDWVFFDELDDDDPKCSNSNVSYFGEHIIDKNGAANYKRNDDGKVVKRTQSEKDLDKSDVPPTEKERIQALESAMLDLLMGGM